MRFAGCIRTAVALAGVIALSAAGAWWSGAKTDAAVDGSVLHSETQQVDVYAAIGAAEPTQTVIVRSGDTLWAIAGRHTPAGVDVRTTVERIRRLNGLDGPKGVMLRPGMKLHVPAAD